MMERRYRDSLPRFQDCFPFHELDRPTILKLNELLPPRKSQSLFVRGNYVAGFILCDLRIRSKAHRKAYGTYGPKGMLDLPTELILEIFQHLHPIDFYNWIRVSKAFRKLFLGRDTMSVWRRAFLVDPVVPSCPPDVSFPKWVSMLFGPSTCDECGGPEAMIDFTFHMRRCDNCFDANRLYRSHFTHFSHHTQAFKDTFWSLVRGSYQYHYPSEQRMVMQSMIYSKPEVDRRADEMSRLLAAVETDAPGAQKNYEKYIQDAAADTRESMKHIRECNMWCSTIYHDLSRMFQQSRPFTVGRWKKRLLAIGHDAKDVGNLEDRICNILDRSSIKKYTNRDFRRSLPVFEKFLKDLKSNRLSNERMERITKHAAAVDTQYNTYVRELNPRLWGYLPDSGRARLSTPIFEHIYSDDESLTLPPESIKAAIHSFVSDWTTFGKARLSSCITDHQTQMHGYTEDSVPDVTNVANAVVTCPKHNFNVQALIGWDDARLHLNCFIPKPPRLVESKDAPSFTFSEAGYHTAVHLLNLLGLSPTTTKANSLEGLRARFMCATCPLTKWAEGRYAMTFKESVSHAINCPGHRPESFVVLTMEATESVLFHERSSITLPSEPSWSCLHCSDYFRNLAQRKAVVLHAQTVHSIQRPIEDVDFLFVKTNDQPPRVKFFVVFNLPSNYRRDRCPDVKKLRLRRMTPLLAHLLDKHGIDKPTENIDWHQVELWKGGNLGVESANDHASQG